MWFCLGDKFNGSIIVDIRCQHDVSKVKFKVIPLSETALGAERRTIMTHQQFLKYTTSSISCNAIVVVNSQHRVCYVCIKESRHTPVITLDQPVYAIAKAIQWDPITRFYEDNYFLFLGPLHSVMLCEKLLGDWVRSVAG